MFSCSNLTDSVRQSSTISSGEGFPRDLAEEDRVFSHHLHLASGWVTVPCFSVTCRW